MSTKRLFIGTFIDKSLFEHLLQKLKHDFSSVYTGKWVELDNLHFTFKFLGDVECRMIPEIKQSLKNYLKSYDEKIHLVGLGAFPNHKKPRILFAKFDCPGINITQISNQIERQLENLGFAKEYRRFNAHITLLRIKAYKSGFAQILENYNRINIGSMSDFTISLIESELTKNGPVYRAI